MDDITKMTDDELSDYAEVAIYRGALLSVWNSDKDKADAAYDEFHRRGKCELYNRAWKRACASHGVSA